MACGRERNDSVGTRTEARFEFNEARTADLVRGEKGRFKTREKYTDQIPFVLGAPRWQNLQEEDAVSM